MKGKVNKISCWRCWPLPVLAACFCIVSARPALAVDPAGVKEGAGSKSAVDQAVAPAASPVISSLSPSASAPAGGAAVTITGAGFDAAQGDGSVTIDGKEATITSWSASEITFTAPAHSAGAADVVVTTGSGKQVEAQGGLTYSAKAECLNCHGFPPPPLASSPAPTGSTVAGAHQIHKGYECRACHGRDANPHPDSAIQIGFDGPPSKPAPCGSAKTGVVGDAYFAQKSVTAGSYRYEAVTASTSIIVPGDKDKRWAASREMTCANIYCHSQGKRLRQGYDLPSVSPSWKGGSADPQGDGKKCNNCHGYPPSFDSHASHAKRNFGCELCHADTTNDGRRISNQSRHANGVYDVVPANTYYIRGQWENLSFVYNSSEKGASCSANTCHLYANYKSETNWISRRQEITDATLSVTQGECRLPYTGAPLASETVTVEVTPQCPDCVGPYTCDFVWGDGAIDTNVACSKSHTYADKMPPPQDQTGTMIGAFDIAWTIRDSYGVTIAGCSRTTRVQVCPPPNVPPVVDNKLTAGPDKETFDVCLQDLSLDPDYNLGTHHDSKGVAPGVIRIDWGISPGQPDGVTEAAIKLTDQPSGEVFCHVYPIQNIYTIRHFIRDNHGDKDFFNGPVRRVRVMKDSIQIR